MPRTVLIADDSELNRAMLHRILDTEYAVLEARDGQEAVAMMMQNHQQISALLLDIVMPKMDGFAVLEKMRGNPALSQIPVIIITSNTDIDTEKKALSLGANDLVIKPFEPEIILCRLQNIIKLRETSAMVNTYQRDKLTGLWNRDTFIEKAARYIERRPPGYYCLSCLDIDNFKVINDRYGSEKGDEVLKALATAIGGYCQQNNGICGRISADNFIALFPNQPIDEDRRRILETVFSDFAGMAVVVSIGRYVVEDKSLPVSAMYDRAIIAQNTVKGRYDEHIAVYDESMRSQLVREQEIINSAKAALAGGQFEPWFQPQYNHATGALIGAEALVRWRHPEWGLVSPGEFIPVFERNGFVYEMDKYVWERVCAYLRKWLDEGRSPLPVSVNISRYDLFRSDLASEITSLVEEYSLPPELLRLEITESAFAVSTERAAEVVKELIDRGFTVEIDDFGSGYSSLNTLKDVPAQILKLDMRFLESGEHSDRGGNILESIIRMSKWLGMSVIAEGVEKLEQADYLKSIGCSYVQGYLYSRPMPAPEYEQKCAGTGREERLISLETVENLDNSSFWNPNSMDTLIFNSYVGAACIFEYNEGEIELIRVTEKYAQVVGGPGFSMDDALKLQWNAHLDEEGLRLVSEAIGRSVETKDEVVGEFVFIDLPGSPGRTYLRSTLRVIAVAGSRSLVYCTNENITAQRNAERLKLDADQQMRALMDDMPGGFARMRVLPDGGLRALYVNKRLCQMRGMSFEEMMGEDGADTMANLHPDDAERYRDCISRTVSTGEISSARCRLLGREGEYSWYSFSFRRTESETGDAFINVYYFDMSAQESRDLSLQETMPLILSAIMDSSQDLAFAKDKDFNYICCSPGFVRFTRQSCEADVVGRNDYDLWTKEEADHFRADDLRLFEGGESLIDFTEPIPSDDGIQHYSVTSKYILRNSAGEIVGLYGCGRDVTDSRAAFDRLKLLTDSVPGGLASYAVSPGGLKLTYFNDGFCKLLGCTREEYQEFAAKSAVVSRVIPEDLPRLMEQLEALRSEGRPIDCTYRTQRMDGGLIWVNLRGILTGRSGDTAYINAVIFDMSDQREAEQRLLNASVQQKAILDNVKSGVAAVVMEGGKLSYIFMNEKYCGMFGYTEEQFKRENPNGLRDIIFNEDLERLGGVIDGESGEGASDLEFRVRCRDGELKWVRYYSSACRLSGVEAPVHVTVLYDVTKEKADAQQLKLLADSVPGGLATYAVSPSGIELVYFTDGYCRMLGYTREEYEKLIAPGVMSNIFKEDLHLIIEQMELVARGAESGHCVYRVHRDFGAGFMWVSLRGSVVERRGDVCYINVMLTDITEREEAMERLRVSAEEYRLAIESSGKLIYRYNHREGSVDLSAGVASIFGVVSHLENVPESVIDSGTVANESIAQYRAFYNAMKRGDPNGSMTVRRRTADGSWRWFTGYFSNIYDGAGNPISAVILFSDVTEELEKEAVFNKWQHSLSEKAPASYTLCRWNVSRDELIDAAEGYLIGFTPPPGVAFNEYALEYAAQLVHPEDRDGYTCFVNADAMLAGYYRGKRLDSMEYRELTADGGFRWLRLTMELVEYNSTTEVEAFLMYEDIDEKKREELLTRELAETDPLTGVLNRKTFAERAALHSPDTAAGMRNALLLLDIDGFKMLNDHFGHAAGDQALIDVADSIGAILRSGDLLGRLGGDEFLICLRDMPSDADIENKARQICAVLRKSYSAELQLSASIGIAVSPRDGSDFDSVYRKADTALYAVKESGKDNFAFYSPEMSGGGQWQESPDTAETVESGQWKGVKRRMLIVEDNRMEAEVLASMFREDFTIVQARDGASALVRLRHYGSAISVVLLDLIMPEMDGYEVLDSMRASPDLQAIPVIVVSGDDSRDVGLRVIQCGAADYVAKPVDREIIRVRVRSAISKAENERLRAQNSLLVLQNDEVSKYRAALESTGSVVVEQDWRTGVYTYDPNMAKFIAGNYDERRFWLILMSDYVADVQDVKAMQELTHRVAENRGSLGGVMDVPLKTPDGSMHRFRMSISKISNKFQLTDKLILTFTDLECGEAK